MTQHFRSTVIDKSRGKWRGILLSLGVDQKFLTGKHCACPDCGGTDRFRFTDHDGQGMSICNQCGGRTGMQLIQALRGWDFKTAAKEIEAVLGEVKSETGRPAMDPQERTEMLRTLWRSGGKIAQGDPVDQYLTNRGLHELNYPPQLRIVQSLQYTHQLSFPAMIAAVQGVDGKMLTIHRTWLSGGDKAPVDAPRKVMPGTMGGHGAIRLSEVTDTLGVAEGIETAMAAGNRFNIPTWATVNAGSMKAFEWPEGVKELVIFGDNDKSYTGQAVSYELARRARSKGLEVSVVIPPEVGTDWADECKRDVAE